MATRAPRHRIAVQAGLAPRIVRLDLSELGE